MLSLRAVCLLACATATDALVLGASRPSLAAATPRVAAPPAMQLFGGPKKTPEEILEEKGYWPGEWVCADCGYIYEPGTTPAFEELRAKWKCPQCAGPRRRFVKKAGNQFGELDDSPLYIGMGLSIFFIIFSVYVGLTV